MSHHSQPLNSTPKNRTRRPRREVCASALVEVMDDDPLVHKLLKKPPSCGSQRGVTAECEKG